MNKKEFLIGLVLIFFACNSDKKQASAYLENAQKLYGQGEYVSAKNNIDSIKILFPKEFGIRKKGMQLRRKIEIKEQERNMIFCDSLLQVRMADAETMKSGFVFEKDSSYDDLGKYTDKSQLVEAKLQTSCIRTQVNESGELLFSGVYYGNPPIHHSRLKVSKSNGDFAETESVPYDGGLNYSFVDGGVTTEVVTYTQGKDAGVIQFIYQNKDSTLKAELFGTGKYTFTISPADKKALVKTFDFAVILSDIDRLKKEKEKSSQRLKYLQGKATLEVF